MQNSFYPIPIYILSTGFFLLSCFSSHAFELEQCEEIFLKGKKISDYIKREEEIDERQRNQKYLSLLKSIQTTKDCAKLLEVASLKDNGLLIERSTLASDILESFNQFHYEWVMPKDLDRSKSCVDKYQWDIFDRKAPAYHLTRTLFQKSRKASQVVTAYGEPRVVRKGEDPIVSAQTGRSAQDYKDHLKVDRELSFMGEGEILGFLFERVTDSSRFELPQSSRSQWIKKIPFKNEHNIYQHFGGGILGSPSFLYYHLKKKAYFTSNGNSQLPRNLVYAIYQNLLCSSPDDYSDAADLKAFSSEFIQGPTPNNSRPEKPLLWDHPITKESSCQSCHFPMDRMASGLRNLTLIPSSQSCSDKDIQILYPVFLKSDHTQEMWTQPSPETKDQENQDFSTSYGVGFFKGKRFRSLTQLGNLIAEDPRFYSCQVKRYYQWIHHNYPDQEIIDLLAKGYQEHQNGLTLIKEVMNRPPVKIQSL